MRSYRIIPVLPMVSLVSMVAAHSATLASAPQDNLARRAVVHASSEYSAHYQARFATDGRIAQPMSRADLDRAWVVNGTTHRQKAQLSLQWDQPVLVAEIVYYARTGWHWGEGWKDYEVCLDEAESPAVKGTLKMGHGPQPIRLKQPAPARKVTLKFLSSFGGPNPGASEIEVYSKPHPDSDLPKFIPPFSSGSGLMVGAVPDTIPESPQWSADLKSGRLGFRELILVQRHHITCSHVYTYHCEGQRDGGGLYRYDVTRGTLRKLIDSSQGQISSCDLSYDGQSILFSWRQGTYYQVYRIRVDGTGLTQLTDGDHHNYDACWLPDGEIAFLSTRRPRAAYCFFTPVGILHRMHPDGSGQTLLSGNFLNDFTPAVLNDGRIIYGRWEYVDRPAIPIQSLWAINPDGTGLTVFFGNRVLDPATFIEPQPIPGTSQVLCTLTGHNGSCRGAIGIIDPVHGNNAQASIRNLTPEVRLRGVEVSSNGPRGPYQTPYPLDQERYLVSYDGTILLRDYQGAGQAIVLAPQDGLGFYNPRPLRPRPRPPVRTPAPTVPAEEESSWATVLVQDIYNGLEPEVKRGEVKQICVVEELPRTLIDSKGIRQPAFDFQRVVVSCGATYVPKKIWGYAKVHPDGSALFRVPSRKAIYFMALDAQGRAIQRMRSFTHLMPGEMRGCVGCHEPRDQTSLVRHPLQSFKGTAVQELQAPEWGRQGFNYASIVQPVLDRHCVECHHAHSTPSGIDLSGDETDYFNVSYETLARGRKVLARRGDGNEVSLDNPYTSWIPTYNGQERNILQIAPKTWGSPASQLACLVLSGHPDKTGAPRVVLTRAEQRRILAWIDLNVPYYGTAETAYPESQACRRQYPSKLNQILMDVASRRCASCHAMKKDAAGRLVDAGIPRPSWTRIRNPHLNGFLLAPLAREAGGSETCGTAVFESREDPDYQAILKTFDPVLRQLKQNPRMDMENAKPAPCFETTSRFQNPPSGTEWRGASTASTLRFRTPHRAGHADIDITTR